MKNLRIVCINTTHSQENEALIHCSDKIWAQLIQHCQLYKKPLYVLPERGTYLFRYFVEKTLNEDGFIIPGDYETETPELGKVEYSIWNEQSDYYKFVHKKAYIESLREPEELFGDRAACPQNNIKS